VPTAAAPTGLRARHKARTRDALAQAARTRFLRHGFEATTVDDIAADADVSPRTFFRYFPTKEDAFFAGFPQEARRFVTLLHGRPPAEAPVDSIRAALHDLLATEESSPEVVRATLALLHTTPALHTAYLGLIGGIETDVVTWAAERLGTDPADLRPRLLAAGAMAARRVAVDCWIDGGLADDLDVIVDRALALLADGLRSL
jgi:AcrR family transcriptional regulator